MSRITAPFVPRLQMEIAFARNTNPQTQNLAPYIIGPNAQLLRYSEATERPLGALGGYDAAGTLVDGDYFSAYTWPGLAVGAEIDNDYTQVHVENAALQYADITDKAALYKGLNKVRHPTLTFASTDAAYPHNAAFGDRGVKVGDGVLVKGVAASGAFSMFTRVRGFIGDLSAAVTGAATPSSGNTGTLVASATPVAGGTNTGDTTLAADGAAYNGFPSGFPSETYRIEVIQASTGGDLTTARLKVTSGSGLDDQLVLQPAAVDTAFAVGTRGLEVTISAAVLENDLAVGDYWTVTVVQAYTAPTITLTGSYGATDYVDRQYLVEVIAGEETASGPVIRVSDTGGKDAAKSYTLAVASSTEMAPVAIGSYGIIATFDLPQGLVTGDRWTIAATASKPTALKTLELANNLPTDVVQDAAATSQLELTFYMIQDMELPRRSETPGVYNFTSHPTEIRIDDNIVVKTADWTINDVQQALPLVTPAGSAGISQLYVTYRAWLPRSTSLQSFTGPTELATLVPGPNHPDNRLKYGCLKALLGNSGRPVYFFNTGNPNSDDGWLAALGAADETRVTYGFVPLTTDTGHLDMVMGHVNSLSGEAFSMYRVAWMTGVETTAGVVLDERLTDDELPVMATIVDDPEQSGTQHTLLSITSGNTSFTSRGVRPNDVVRFNYDTDGWGDETYTSYTVSRVLNDSTLVLVGGPTLAENVAKRFEIHRTLTAEERVNAFKGQVDGTLSTGVTGSRYTGYLARILAFPIMYDGALEVPSYYAACVLAGLRSSYAPQQPLTRSGVPGFSGVKDIEKFNTTQLNEMAASGGFILAPDVIGGNIVVRHAVTAGDWDDVNQREESVIANIHSNLFYLFSSLDPYIGKSTASDDTIAAIGAELIAGRTFLQSANASPGLGSQLVDLIIYDLRPTPAAKDALFLDMEMQLNGPLNNLRVKTLIR